MEDIKQIQPYTIYLFTKQKVLYGVAKANEGVEFGQGFKLVKDKKSKLNTPAIIYKRAKRSVVAAVSNALNVIQMFGEKAFDDNGNIDWDKFQMEEFKRAFELAKEKDSSYDKKVYDFKIIEISLKNAKELKLI